MTDQRIEWTPRGKTSERGWNSYYLSHDSLGAWHLSRFNSDSGDEEHRAAGSEHTAKRFAKRDWGVLRWEREGERYFVATDEEPPLDEDEEDE